MTEGLNGRRTSGQQPSHSGRNATASARREIPAKRRHPDFRAGAGWTRPGGQHAQQFDLVVLPSLAPAKVCRQGRSAGAPDLTSGRGGRRLTGPAAHRARRQHLWAGAAPFDRVTAGAVRRLGQSSSGTSSPKIASFRRSRPTALTTAASPLQCRSRDGEQGASRHEPLVTQADSDRRSQRGGTAGSQRVLVRGPALPSGHPEPHLAKRSSGAGASTPNAVA